MGGTNFRVLLMHLKDERDFDVQSKTYAISEVLMLGTGRQLFDYIAECLALFMKVFNIKTLLSQLIFDLYVIEIQEQNIDKERIPLGFTFSYELKQLALAKALLVKWAKGFDCSGVVDEDVVQLLNEAIDRRGVGSISFD